MSGFARTLTKTQAAGFSRYALTSLLFIACAITAAAQKGKGGGCPAYQVPPSDTKCYLGSGCLDSFFGQQGIVFGPFNAELAVGAVEQVLVQPGDGKLVLIGFGVIQGPTGGDLLVVRLNPDGSPDTSFGDNDPFNPGQKYGYALVDLGGQNDRANAGALLPDGSIIAGGGPDQYTETVVRLHPDGSLDASFGINGRAVIPSSNALWLQDLVVDSSGRIVLGGGEPTFTAVRLNPDGSLDTSFGNGGTASVLPTTASNGGYGLSRTIALQPDESGVERIVIGGWSRRKAGDKAAFALVRFNDSGSLDASFGAGGRVSAAFAEGSSQIFDIAIDQDNKIVAVGNVTPSCGGIDVALARFSVNGSLDMSFSGDGKLSVNVYGGDDGGRSVAIQGDGKVAASGYAQPANTTGSDRHFVLIRLNPDGSFDSGFGPGLPGFFGSGIVTTDVANSAYGLSLELQTDGKLVVAGPASQGAANFAVARYWY